ncbi:hypothetical protein [Acinetobacter ursingii]|uniref:hypothetical protein n=1 Tax=Acinetobacter ursingii TaxID=108980 RepID=UPI0021CD7F95|nr:hypothetical protein [Acinetobacter ursingii]MCU4482117.1 hypothetical protein [Acinetobacter ursingii]MCU4506307.1 hypothetical protein [Acinetobacter ursingii]MCU4570655.1 hypothetical protein [Acinetobacter ursingii]
MSTDPNDFNIFWESKKIINADELHNSLYELHNSLYELFNNIRQFNHGGKFGLYKEQAVEWGLPTIVLELADLSDRGDLDILKEGQDIYRGMSWDEYISGKFGQSWTTDIDVARKFSETTYSDRPKGIIVKTRLIKENVIHYENAVEYEVIMVNYSVKKSNIEKVCIKNKIYKFLK